MTGSEQAQFGLWLAAAFAVGWLALGVMLAWEGRGERGSAPEVGELERDRVRLAAEE